MLASRDAPTLTGTLTLATVRELHNKLVVIFDPTKIINLENDQWRYFTIKDFFVHLLNFLSSEQDTEQGMSVVDALGDVPLIINFKQ